MTDQPQLSSIDIWSYRERVFKALLWEALRSLADQSTETNENDLNRCLFRAIIRATHQAAQNGEDVPIVVYEGRNLPAASDHERAEREFKIPDFYWAFIDPLANDPDDSCKQFVVECKRLTNPFARYTGEYVKSGIVRFINVRHGYGKGMKSGAMVGYLQDVLIDAVIAGVNAVAIGESITGLVVQNRNGELDAELTHEVTRSFAVSPFQLTHAWTRIGPSPSH